LPVGAGREVEDASRGLSKLKSPPRPVSRML
jgi:hypothetical protein